jgi:hypothetical protein
MGRGAYYYAGDCCASANSGWVGIKNRNAQKKTPVTDVTINTGTCTIPWGAVPKISPPSHAWQFKVVWLQLRLLFVLCVAALVVICCLFVYRNFDVAP